MKAIVRAVASLVAVSAFPVKAPTKLVDVTDVRPASVAEDDPRPMVVEPRVIPPLLIRYVKLSSISDSWTWPDLLPSIFGTVRLIC